MSILNARALLIVAATLLAAFGLGYRKGAHDTRADLLQDVERWRSTAEVAYELYQKTRDQKDAQYRVVNKRVEAAKNATPDIPDCRTSDDWMRIFRDNAAIANGAVPSDSGGAGGTDPG
jgi:hypothetical protein